MPRRHQSKRKRRQQTAQQRKRCRKGANYEDILSPELLAELGGGVEQEGCHNEENSLVLGQKTSLPDEAAKKPENISRNQLRKMKQVKEKKARHKRLAEVFSVLSQHQLKAKEAVSMRPIHKKGQRETNKERQERSMKMKELGVPVLIDSRMACQDLSGGSSDPQSSDSELEEVRSEISDTDASLDGLEILDEGATGKKGQSGHLVAHTALKPRVFTDEEVAEHARKVKEDLDLSYDEIADENVEECAGKMRHCGPHRVVAITRRPEIEECRSKLPIIGMEQEIMEMVNGYDVMVLCGQTGCGKTTQVPQFLYEAGFGCKGYPEKQGMIGVTQPRRVAAISTAKRVADEMDSDLGEIVGYQVRYDHSIGSRASLKFMTDGILMRELQQDFLLNNYSVIIVDEAHERSLNTDLLLGMLSRIVPLRRKLSVSDPTIFPLKLIIMSATLRKEDFVCNARLFPQPPPVINVASRQYPVHVHFSKRTEISNYVDSAYRKVCRIHRDLPPGGILVFVTGQREVDFLCKKLRRAFSPKINRTAGSMDQEQTRSQSEVDVEMRAIEESESESICDEQYGVDAAEAQTGLIKDSKVDLEWDSEVSDLDTSDDESDEEEVVVMGADGVTPEEIAAQEKAFDERFRVNRDKGQGCTDLRHGPVVVLPLYAMLPAEKQAQVFAQPPEGSRLIVVATNVAETSITIPNIRFVVDAGRSKQKILDGNAGMAKFEVRWISKAAAEQRAGRAGRTVPGHCYRLYSSAHFNDTFPEHTPPEIMNTSLEGVVLMMKSLGVNKVVNFPFPTSPDGSMLKEAESTLVALSAVDPVEKRITELGKVMVGFPVSPRHSRMIVEAIKLDEMDKTPAKAVVSYAVALAAALNEQSPFIHIDTLQPDQDPLKIDNPQKHARDDDLERSQLQKKAREAHDKFLYEDSDAIGALKALCAYERAGRSDSFCKKHFLHARNLREMSSLHQQLVGTFHRQNIPGVSRDMGEEMGLPVPDSDLVRKLARVIAAGWCDQVARRVRSAEYLNKLQSDGKSMRAVRYIPCNSQSYIYLHPNSRLHKTAQEYVVYMEVLQTEKRPYMHGITAVEPGWLSHVAPAMCSLSEPLTDPAPYYKADTDKVMCWRTVKYGQHAWELPIHASEHPDKEGCCLAFARALLDGKVIGGLKEFRDALVVPSAVACRAETRFNSRFGQFIDQLLQRQVCCKSDLLQVWKTQPEFLLKELLLWMRKQVHAALEGKWRSLDVC